MTPEQPGSGIPVDNITGIDSLRSPQAVFDELCKLTQENNDVSQALNSNRGGAWQTALFNAKEIIKNRTSAKDCTETERKTLLSAARVLGIFNERIPNNSPCLPLVKEGQEAVRKLLRPAA